MLPTAPCAIVRRPTSSSPDRVPKAADYRATRSASGPCRTVLRAVRQFSMQGQYGLAHQITVQNVRIEVNSAFPGHHIRYRVDRYPAESLLVGERPKHLGHYQIAEIDVAFE